MKNEPPIICEFQVRFRFDVFFTQDVFNPANNLLRELLNHGVPEKLLVVIEEPIVASMPALIDDIRAYFSHPESGVELVAEPVIFAGGETLKNNFSPVEELHGLVERHGLSRHSYLAAIGGGALLDVAGFAAATAHRGIRHLRLPTTTLSQADGGVGVKNAVNVFGKKNFVGTFAPPFAVINDSEFLRFLPDSRKSAGYVEAIKVGLIRDRDFFAQIERSADALNRFEPVAMNALIRRSAELHIRHISEGGDPFEFGSARPLDFGHWAAHKLEQLSNFRISHAEAVAIGLALDVIYSRNAGHLASGDADRILALLKKLGFPLFAPELLQEDEAGERAILAGLSEFQQHLGGQLAITLLREIGRGFEVHEMSRPGVREAIDELRERFSK
jgi:3-dehydroquinate synthase